MSRRVASYVLAAARRVDGVGSLAQLHAAWASLQRQGARVAELVVDPLSAGWDTPMFSNHFRSGCAPVEALHCADTMLREGRVDAVLIQGQDHLRSDYAHDKVERQRLMAIYGPDCRLPHAYTLLAQAFMHRHGIDATRFRALARALFDNYSRTAARNGHPHPPEPRKLHMATDLFRFVDCANPVVDFAGAMVVGTAELAPVGKRLGILGVGLGPIETDGPEHVEIIARYDHLAGACRSACEQAGFDLAPAFHSGAALIEAYTCFPVAPLGFLLATGIARNIDEIEPILAAKEITVTGGMNLARAAWNNPALNAMIVMCQRLRAGDAQFGAIHGNGGLGYRQGLAIIGVRN